MTVQVSAEHGNSGAGLLAGTWSVSDAMPSFLHRQRLTWHPQQSLHKVIKLPTARSSAPWQKSGILEKKKMPKSSLENKKSLCTQKGETSDLETWLWSFLPSPCHSFTCLCSWELQIGISSGVPNHNACSRCCCSAGPVWAGRRCTCRLWSLLHTRVEGKPRMPSALLPHNHVDVGVDSAIVHAAAYLLVLYTDLESLLTHCDTKLCPIRFSVAWMSQCILQPKHPINKGLFKCH